MTTTRAGATTKTAIQAAAMGLFVSKGFAETSIRDIARAVSFSEGALYRHYPSKDALVTDLFASNYTAYARTLDALQAKERGFAAKLGAMIADIYRLFDEDPTLFRFLLLIQHQALPQLPDDIESPVKVLQKVVHAAIASGEIAKADGQLVAAMILGAILQPAVFNVYRHIESPLSRHTDEVLAACLRIAGS
jgi:AcrR family transcriptional regulator